MTQIEMGARIGQELMYSLHERVIDGYNLNLWVGVSGPENLLQTK